MPKSRTQLTDQEREQRRAEDRERVKAAAQELLCSEWWARWVRARQLFHRYPAFILGAACRSCRLAVVCCR